MEKTVKAQMEITVNTLGRKTIILKVKSSNTIKSVKEKIQEKERIPIEQQCLIHKCQKLEDIKTLFDYDIKNESILQLLLKFHGGMQIFVFTLDGKKIPLEVESTDTIDDVKKMINEKIGTPVEMQQLLYYWENLKNGAATLSECNIINGCTLHLIRNLAGYYNVMSFK